MTHLWLRAEQRPNEQRAALTPEGAKDLIARGLRLTVEESPTRVFAAQAYQNAGCEIAPTGTWPSAPENAIILGLKELPEDDSPLPHRHIMFGHAYKGQPAGRRLLARFKAGGGTLYDLEYLLDDDGRRLAAFGYWAGYAGAAVSLRAWVAQAQGLLAGPVGVSANAQKLQMDLHSELQALGANRPRALVIGALGRVGRGASDFCKGLGVPVTAWDQAETAHGGPFPEVLDHDILFNCILAQPGAPVFVPQSAAAAPRRLRVIGDIACDPESDFSPIKVYSEPTSWAAPALRVHQDPPLDVMAVDNLPSLLPLESSEDFAAQLLPCLQQVQSLDANPWARAEALFHSHLAKL